MRYVPSALAPQWRRGRTQTREEPMRHPWPLLVLAAALGCGGGADDIAAPQRGQFALSDPLGDTLASTFATAQAHDVLNFRATPEGASLVVWVHFAHDVAPFSSGGRNGVLGIMDLDVDGDAATGAEPLADRFGGTAGIGAEWSLFLEDSVVAAGDHRVAIVSVATQEVFWVPASFDGATVTARVPLAMLRAQPGARIRMVGVVGSVERASDIFPNEGSIEIALP
jgi:hypothetical protein